MKGKAGNPGIRGPPGQSIMGRDGRAGLPGAQGLKGDMGIMGYQVIFHYLLMILF